MVGGAPLGAGLKPGARGENGGGLCAAVESALGDAYQFDWSHEVLLMGGVTVTVKVVTSACVTAV